MIKVPSMTDDQRNLSRKYLIYRTLTNFWFMGAIWLFFYRIFINDQQVGILDGMAFAIGLLAEVPSGALADKFGRDKMVRIGQVCAGTGILIQAVGSSFMPFFVGQAITMIGLALVSGADEALFFEKLNFKRESTAWRKLVTRGAQFGLIGSVLATTVGGALHMVNPRIPWILTGLAFIVAAILIWPIRDTRPRAERQAFMPELVSYLQNIRIGFMQFTLPKLRLYLPLILIVQGLFYTVGYGLLRPIFLIRFDFNAFWGSIVVASASLIAVGALALMHKHADRISEKRVLAAVGLSAAAALLLSVADIGMWGYAVILALYLGEHLLSPFMSEILNNHAPEDQRATVLSVASFLKTLPYVLLAPLIGYLNTNGKLHYYLLSWGVLIIIAVTAYLLFKRRDTLIEAPAGE